MLESTRMEAVFRGGVRAQQCNRPFLRPTPQGYPSVRELTRGDTTWLSQQLRFMQDREYGIALSRRDTIPLSVHQELAPAGYPQHTPETIQLAHPRFHCQGDARSS